MRHSSFPILTIGGFFSLVACQNTADKQRSVDGLQFESDNKKAAVQQKANEEISKQQNKVDDEQMKVSARFVSEKNDLITVRQKQLDDVESTVSAVRNNADDGECCL